MKKNCDELKKWMLENGDDPRLDIYLRDMILDMPDAEDNAVADEAFLECARKTGMRKHSRLTAVYSRYSRIAAILLLPVLIAGSFLLVRMTGDGNNWIQTGTSYGQSESVKLSDGTTVKLASCSTIYYPKHFSGRERRIFLSGEAFFDVAKDARHKFIVTAGDLQVAVHGTRFNMTSFPGDAEDEVALVEGSVEVSFSSSDGNIFLKPGEMVKYDKESRTAERRKFATNYYEEVVNNDGIQFVNDRLCDIASELSRRFNIPIIVENGELAAERYYATFINNEDADRILESLNTQNSFTIKHEGNSIHIY